MEAILNCRTEDLEDYYGLLGCDELSTVNTQVTRTYDSSFRGCVLLFLLVYYGILKDNDYYFNRNRNIYISVLLSRRKPCEKIW